MTLVLGVDGGNTKTVALVARADGRVLGAGRGGCADVYGAASPEAALREIEHAVTAALVRAGAGGADISSAVFSLAGADWPEDYALQRTELPRRIGLRATPLVINDSIGAIRTGTRDGVGVAVVVGTGGAIGGRNRAGECWHLGFWPDGMGSRAIGRAALRAVWRADLEFDPPTMLTVPVLEASGVATPRELLHAYNRRGGIDRQHTAHLAPIVLDAAAAGDATAARIIAESGDRLGEAAAVTARRVGLPGDFTIVLSGGVLRHPAARHLTDAILAHVPDAQPVRARHEPAVGALLYAYDALGLAPNDALIDASLPGSDLFETR
jgi:N-acetylglucosamine kinase-like BadF-type ATPase